MADLVGIITAFGYVGIALVVFAESGLFFGFFLPGDSLLFTAGFLASQEILSVTILIPLLATLAILGDSVGYAFGKYIGPKLFNKPESRFWKPTHIKTANEFFLRHGKKAIFLARFAPIIRTFVPIVAGVAQMPYKEFLLYNIIGGVSWVGSMTLLGYFLGQLLPATKDHLTVISLGIIGISLTPLLWEYRKHRNSKV